MNTLLWYTDAGVPAMYSLSVENIIKNGAFSTGTVKAVNMQNLSDVKTASFNYDGSTNTFEVFSAPNIRCDRDSIFTNYKNVSTVSRMIMDTVRW